jgi:hypothetical protein
MDKQTTSNSLSGVRTFAKDLAKKQALEASTPGETKETEIASKSIPKPEAKEEPRIYQAPSWTGNKNKPNAKTEPEIKVIKPITKKTEVKEVEEKPEPEQTLKPLSAPKKEGETIIVESEDTRPGVIITDAKRNRFRLFPAIFKSIGRWFADLRQKQVASKIPKYTVPETSHRKGVIQRATSKTGKFASADAPSIHERIRLRKERAIPKTPTTIWTANTEPGFPLLEAGENKISNVKVVLKKSFHNLTEPALIKDAPTKPTAPEIASPKVIAEPLPNIRGTVREVVVAPIVSTPAPTEIKKPIIVAEPVITAPTPKIEATVIQRTEPASVTLTEETEEIVEEKVTQLRPTNIREWLFSRNINTISIGVFGAVLALIIVSVSGYFWISSKLPDPSLNTTPDYQTLIEGPLQLVYPKTLTRAGLFEEVINSFQTTEGDVAQQIFVASQNGQTLLKSETVIETLDFSLDPAFLKSISYIYFGGLRKSVPFILLDTADYTTARGGMLNWETSIYEDLSPLFNYNQLYDAGSIKTAVFTDSVIEKNDVRILRTLSGSELLVYGLINRDIIVITTNTTAFTEITNLLK